MLKHVSSRAELKYLFRKFVSFIIFKINTIPFDFLIFFSITLQLLISLKSNLDNRNQHAQKHIF